MSDNKQNNALAILKHNFGRPRAMTWGWPVMLFTLITAVIFMARCILKDTESPFPVTSLVGCSFFVILITLAALVFPAVFCARGIEDRPVGRFTGVGVLILSFLSGIPLMMVRVPLYNIMAWITLRFSRSSIFPVFFHTEPNGKEATILAILSDVIIPAFGAAIFFFGLLWTRFRSSDRLQAYVVITTCFVLYKMDYTSLLAFIATGIWCCFLRSRIYNMWGPFLCLVSAGIAEMYLPETLARIDIYAVQTYADIGSTYFYSSLPAFFMGMVLLLFFIRVLDSFAISVRHEVTGTEDDEIIPPFDKSVNLSLLLTIGVFTTVWILLLKGVCF